MRTTIAIDDGLLATAKHRARQKHCTLGQLIEESLQTYLASDVGAEEAPPLPVSSARGGLRPGVDLSTNRAIYEFLDGEDRLQGRA